MSSMGLASAAEQLKVTFAPLQTVSSLTRNWTPSGWSVMKRKPLYQWSTYDTESYKLGLLSVCKEVLVRKKNLNVLFYPINNISECNGFVLLRVTRQSDRKFYELVRTNLVKANKCFHVLRSL